MQSGTKSVLRNGLLLSCGLMALGSAHVALASETPVRPTGSEESNNIVIRNDLNPNTPPPTGVLDSGVNGVGQMVIRANPNTTATGLCTGTLINPRTVIFAAHCVNSRPAQAYGPNGVPFGAHTAGGTPISFGFEANNLPAVRRWLGLDGGVAGATDVSRSIYSVEQVWYDPRSLLPESQTFLIADVAIATLDTPAFNIPTWAMLFSPLDGPTHAVITGYGNAGRENQTASGTVGGIAIDWRRRAAENMISVLGSFADRNAWIFGPGSGGNTNNLYMLSFNDPNPAYNPAAGKFDFGIFGDTALPREGTTAGGDSGGPLIADQRYDRPVVVGVLSGGSRFFGAQQFHGYGSHSFYQPLHLYWDLIASNNPYVYATTRGRNAAWEDASNWIQAMDPNYFIDVNGKLVNGVPDTPGQGIAAGGAKFGTICFLDDCTSISGSQPSGNGNPVIAPGGPGTTNFVPNNIVANPSLGIKARYFDVTLSRDGTTTLSSAVTIDRMTMDGRAKFDIRNSGQITVLGDFDQFGGWTNVDGRIKANEMLLAAGILSGRGVVETPFVTVAAGVVAPAGADEIGTLSFTGNLILSSGSAYFVDANRTGADQLSVGGQLLLSGGSVVFNNGRGAAPRHNDSFIIANAAGGVSGTFGSIYAFQGVLRPELTYSANEIRATMRAGSLANQIGRSGATEIAFARALDQMRGRFYDSLYGLYGAIDLMDGQTLAVTLRGLAPTITSESRSLQERQSRMMLNNVSDRLSLLGTGPTGTLSVNGSQAMLAAMSGQGSAATLGYSSLVPSSRAMTALPEGMTGFMSSSYSVNNASTGDARANVNGGQHSWQVGMGLEMEVAPGATIGTAVGYADGFSAPGLRQDRTENRTTQAAFYGSYRLGGGAYVAGLASAEQSRMGLLRQGYNGDSAMALTGATNAQRYNLMVEAGVNLEAARGLQVTPRASIGYSSYHLDGFRETGGEVALQLNDMRVQQLESRIGATVGGTMRMAGGWNLTPQLRADFVSSLSGANGGMQVRFANAADHVFALPLANGDTHWGEVRGGLQFGNGRIAFGAGVESSVGRSDYRDDRAVADFTVRF